MTLHIYNDLVQGSDEWLEARRGIVTASVVGQLVTPKKIQPAANVHSRSLTAQLVAERITGWVDDPYVSRDMLRGSLNEPVARGIYAEHYAPVDECGFMVRAEGGWRLGYSPDGLVGDDGLIEIKWRWPKEHLAHVLADEVPAENMAQIQAGLLVSGRQWCDYVSFCDGMRLWTKRVTPDERWLNAIASAVEQFEQAAADMVERYHQATAGLPITERGTYDMDVVI